MERAEHVRRMHTGMQSIINLMPTTTEVGGVSLLDMGLRGVCVMRDDDDITAAEAHTLRESIVAAFQAAHPNLDARLSSELSILNGVIAQVIDASMADDDLVQLARETLSEFKRRGLETIQ